MTDSQLDRAQLLSAARSYLEWEAELTGFGLPASVARPAAQQHVQPSAPAQAHVSAPVQAQVDAPEPAPAHAHVLLPLPLPVPFVPEPPAPPRDKRLLLSQLDNQVRACSRCELAKGRTHTVFARGNPDSQVVFVGEGPGQEEDRVGSPFVGAAGQLLDKMIAAMGYARDDVYICNVVKCRPPGNRTPLPAEAAACAPYLLGQLDLIAPRVIVALGRCAAENMGLVQGGGWRGRWGKFRGVDVMPTYHPAFLLRSPEFKRPVWEDLQKVMGMLKVSG